jgi:hypothetical protein
MVSHATFMYEQHLALYTVVWELGEGRTTNSNASSSNGVPSHFARKVIVAPFDPTVAARVGAPARQATSRQSRTTLDLKPILDALWSSHIIVLMPDSFMASPEYAAILCSKGDDHKWNCAARDGSSSASSSTRVM